MAFHNLLCETAIALHGAQSLAFAKEGLALYRGSAEAKENYVREKLREILRYAVENTAYYAEAFAGREPEIENAPVLTKAVLRQSYGEICSSISRKGLYENTSGGSTGEPVKFLQDREYYDKNFGNKILFGLLNGKRPGDFEIKLWGSERDILQGDIGIKEKLINFIYNRMLLNSFVMSEDRMLQYLDCINTRQPVSIWAYADSIYELACCALREKVRMFSPRVIITTAGVLYDDMRKTIQRCFPGSLICNQYGSREVGAVGIEVQGEKGIRTFDHSVYIEILNESTGQISKEGTGRILVTSLINKAMPLIRFDIGDIGTLTQQTGEREGSFGVLTELKGRVNSHIRRKSGALIHGEYFTHLFYGKSWIRNFQVVQRRDYSLELLIRPVRDGERVLGDIEEMKRGVKAVMPEAELTVRYVEEIPRLKSGKHQFVISEVEGAEQEKQDERYIHS